MVGVRVAEGVKVCVGVSETKVVELGEADGRGSCPHAPTIIERIKKLIFSLEITLDRKNDIANPSNFCAL